jgi:hypothetical protein
VKTGDVIAALGALVALALAVFAWVRPGRISPAALLVIAALLGLRYAARRQAHKREQMLKEVPRRPLGLSDEPPDSKR